MTPDKPIETVRYYGHYTVTGPVTLPLSVGDQVSTFTHDGFLFRESRYSSLYKGEIGNADNLLVRVSSNCQWAFYFGSQYCDCVWQMEESKRRIAEEGKGLIVFAHDQHGKGVGIEKHWMVYAEGQRQGLELVVDAYEQLGLNEDYRDYGDVMDILNHYGISTIRLLTNSPRRIEIFERSGIHVVSIEPLEQPINPHLKQEYGAKKRKLDHFLKVPDSDLE